MGSFSEIAGVRSRFVGGVGLSGVRFGETRETLWDRIMR
jgi:hypothetical protein